MLLLTILLGYRICAAKALVDLSLLLVIAGMAEEIRWWSESLSRLLLAKLRWLPSRLVLVLTVIRLLLVVLGWCKVLLAVLH